MASQVPNKNKLLPKSFVNDNMLPQISSLMNLYRTTFPYAEDYPLDSRHEYAFRPALCTIPAISINKSASSLIRGSPTTKLLFVEMIKITSLKARVGGAVGLCKWIWRKE